MNPNNETKTEDQDSRAKLCAFVATARHMLGVNPKTALSTLSKMIGVDVTLGAMMKELKVIEELPDGENRWASTDPDEAVVDKLILHRREKNRARSTVSRAEIDEWRTNVFARFDELRASVVENLTAFEKRIAAIEQRPAGGITDEDKEILNLALTDKVGMAKRIEELERIVGNILRAEAAKTVAQAPAAATPPTPVASATPTKAPRVIVLGVFPRDQRHIRDALTGAGLNGRAKGVELYSPEDRLSVSVATADQVFYTVEAVKQVREFRQAHPRNLPPMTLVNGGNTQIATEIVRYLSKS
jgi:hypothetical protein